MFTKSLKGKEENNNIEALFPLPINGGDSLMYKTHPFTFKQIQAKLPAEACTDI